MYLSQLANCICIKLQNVFVSKVWWKQVLRLMATWVGAGAVGGFLRKWLHISLDQDHLAQNTILFVTMSAFTENNTLPGKQWMEVEWISLTEPQKERPMSWSSASTTR